MSSQYETYFQEHGALNEGQLTSVFKARSNTDGKFYAIKKIPFAAIDEQKTILEIKYLLSLNSDYVVKLIQHWIEPNYYIGTRDDKLSQTNLLFDAEKIMLLHIQLELCSMPLNYVIRILNHSTAKNSMSSRHYSLACEVLIQLLECVNYFHTLSPNPLLHRDLKPENIMLVKGENNRFVKLIDFGISTYHDFVNDSKTKYVGEKQYRAPEVYTGKYDMKADIYSLGLIIQELFNIDFNRDTNNVEADLKSHYEKLMKLCTDCLETVANKRPTCEDILKVKDSWAYFSPKENSYDRIKEIATEKYQILFNENFEDYQKAINSPILLDAYSKALMNCFDRKQMIADNLRNWRQLINLEILLPALTELLPVVAQKMFSIEVFNTIMDYFSYITEADKKKEFILQKFMDLNNENEFKIFIQILLHTGHDELAFNLYPPCIDMIDLKRCDPKNGFIPYFSFGFYNKRDALNRAKKAPILEEDYYPMDKSPRGLCYIVNNYFTVGTYREIQRFRNIFHQLDFDVVMKKNLDATDLRKRLLNLSKSEELNAHNAFVFLSITHGSENNEIYGFDGKKIEISKIVEMFDNENCPQLQNKPKMFFFNCCRGPKHDSGVPQAQNISLSSVTDILPSKQKKSLPKKNDFIICYSTLDEYVAYVDWYTGTIFGQAFADVLVENACCDDLNTILTKTAGKSTVEQPFERSSVLKKLIKFFSFPP